MEIIAYITSAIAISALACDWMQTLRCALTVSHLFEVNFLLGPRPSPRRVNIYFAMSAVVVIVALVALISLRKFDLAIGLAGVLAALELCCVINNWSLGVAPRFKVPATSLKDAGLHQESN